MAAVGLSSCEIAKNSARPASAIATGELIKKDPKNEAKFLLVADGLDLLAGGINKELTIADFNKVVLKAGVSNNYAILAQYLFDIYKEKVSVSSNFVEAAKVLKDIAQGIRDGVAINVPAK
jgi:hypothetical protein